MYNESADSNLGPFTVEAKLTSVGGAVLYATGEGRVRQILPSVHQDAYTLSAELNTLSLWQHSAILCSGIICLPNKTSNAAIPAGPWQEGC